MGPGSGARIAHLLICMSISVPGFRPRAAAPGHHLQVQPCRRSGRRDWPPVARLLSFGSSHLSRHSGPPPRHACCCHTCCQAPTPWLLCPDGLPLTACFSPCLVLGLGSSISPLTLLCLSLLGICQCRVAKQPGLVVGEPGPSLLTGEQSVCLLPAQRGESLLVLQGLPQPAAFRQCSFPTGRATGWPLKAPVRHCGAGQVP